jgi:hypothetical protein
MRIQIVDDAGGITEIEPVTLYVFSTKEKYLCRDCHYGVDEFCCVADSPQEAVDKFIHGFSCCVACRLEGFGYVPLINHLYGISDGEVDKGNKLFSSSSVGWFILKFVYLDEDLCRDIERIAKETKVLLK